MNIENLIVESKSILKELKIKPTFSLISEVIGEITNLKESDINEKLYDYIFKKFLISEHKDFDKFLTEFMTGVSIQPQIKTDLKAIPERPVEQKDEFEEGEDQEDSKESEKDLPEDIQAFLEQIGLSETDEKGARVFLFRFKDIIKEYIKDIDTVNMIVYLLYSARFNEPLSEGEILELQDIIKKFTNDPKKEINEYYKRLQEADPEDSDEDDSESDSEDQEDSEEDDNEESSDDMPQQEYDPNEPKESPKKDNMKPDEEDDSESDNEDDSESDNEDEEDSEDEDTKEITIKKKSKNTSDDDEDDDNTDEKKSKLSTDQKIGIIATMVVGTLLFGIGGLLITGLMAVIAGQSDEDYEESKKELTDEDTKDRIENGEEPDEDKVEKVKEKPSGESNDPEGFFRSLKNKVSNIKDNLVNKAKLTVRAVAGDSVAKMALDNVIAFEDIDEDGNSFYYSISEDGKQKTISKEEFYGEMEDLEDSANEPEEEPNEDEEESSEESEPEEKPDSQKPKEKKLDPNKSPTESEQKTTDAEKMQPDAYKKKWGKCPDGWKWDSEKNKCIKSTASESVDFTYWKLII